jgi:hypothetical protein
MDDQQHIKDAASQALHVIQPIFKTIQGEKSILIIVIFPL